MTPTPKKGLPPWLTERTVWSGGWSLLAAAAVTAVGVMWLQRTELESRARDQAEVHARTLEDHATRSLDAVDVVLSALQDGAAKDHQDSGRREALSQTMATMIQGLPFVRSISLVDTKGKVLASSNPSNLEAHLDLGALGATDRPMGGVVPRLMIGRDLGQWALDRATGTAQASDRSFLPVLRRLGGQGEPELWLVATLNPDYFANQHSLTLNNDRALGALLAYDGILLTSTQMGPLEPGSPVRQHVVFTDYLPQRESASLVGTGLEGGKAVIGFRSLKRQPMVVLVEQPYDQVTAPLWAMAGWGGLGLGMLSLLILGLTATAARSLRSHNQVAEQLDDAHERMADSERELRVLIEGVREWIFRTDAAGHIRYVNPRWQQITQRPDSDALGMALPNLMAERDRSAVQHLLAHAARGPQAPLAVRLNTADGEGLPIELSLSALFGPDGSLQGFAGFGADVSAREQARRRLQAQLDFTAQLVEATPTPIFVKDEFGRLIMVNKAWSDLTGLCLLGQAAGQGGEPPESPAELAALQAGQVLRREGIHRRSDGALRHTITTKVAFTQSDGTAAGLIGSIVDVTEYREAVRATRQAKDAAETANRIKSEFIANMSHELRTPLQSIIGFSELGVTRAGDAGRLREMFQRIHAGGERMLALVNDLLDVAKLDGDARGLQFDEADMVLLTQEVLAEFEPLTLSRKLTLTLTVQDAAPPRMALDGFRFQQVVRNLLANALRYSPEGGQIVVTLACTDTEVRMTVEDQGPGIPEAELEAIFEPFVQSTRTKDGSGGTGLGLAICRRIMQGHGGWIRAGNREGGGARLSLGMPIRQPA